MNGAEVRILIIKLGYSETLDPEIGKVPSFGDILRTTPMLRALKEKFPSSHITWLVSESAEPLLRWNPFIDRILVWDEFVPFQLMRERIDILINLEKIPGLAALSDMIDAWTKYGFRFDGNTGNYHTYERGLDFLRCIEGKSDNSVVRDVWQKVLIEMLGVAWKEQDYVIGYRSKSQVEHDVGFNFQVGSKFPKKALPLDLWKKLEQGVRAAGYSVSWQEGHDDLLKYMDWLHSCRLIVTQDSLGLHIALALKKKVVALFGPTDPREVCTYGKAILLRSATKCPFMPCYTMSRCQSGAECMANMDLGKIVEAVVTLIDEDAAESSRVYAKSS